MTFNGTIKEGKLFLDKAEQFRQHLHTFPTGKRVELTVERFVQKRTLPQNAYLHSVIIPMIAKETGQDAETVKGFLK
jgi:hypothetical protein